MEHEPSLPLQELSDQEIINQARLAIENSEINLDKLSDDQLYELSCDLVRQLNAVENVITKRYSLVIDNSDKDDQLLSHIISELENLVTYNCYVLNNTYMVSVS